MIDWKKLGKNTYEGTKGKYDFHISPDKQLQCFLLDVFKSNVKDADEAHVDTETHPDVESAKSAAEKYS